MYRLEYPEVEMGESDSINTPQEYCIFRRFIWTPNKPYHQVMTKVSLNMNEESRGTDEERRGERKINKMN